MKITPEQLSAFTFLKGLDEATLAELARSALFREYTPGALIFLEGDPASAIYYLQSGWIKVSKNSVEGREQILRTFGPGETFNELSVFANRANPATATALEAVGLWLIPRVSVHRLLVSHPEVGVHVIENIADHVIHLVSLVADLSLLSVEERIARFLLEEAEEEVMIRQHWATQSELASRLGTVPDVLSRALRRMVGHGAIELNRNEIRILDREMLETMASG